MKQPKRTKLMNTYTVAGLACYIALTSSAWASEFTPGYCFLMDRNNNVSNYKAQSVDISQRHELTQQTNRPNGLLVQQEFTSNEFDGAHCICRNEDEKTPVYFQFTPLNGVTYDSEYLIIPNTGLRVKLELLMYDELAGSSNKNVISMIDTPHNNNQYRDCEGYSPPLNVNVRGIFMGNQIISGTSGTMQVLLDKTIYSDISTNNIHIGQLSFSNVQSKAWRNVYINYYLQLDVITNVSCSTSINNGNNTIDFGTINQSDFVNVGERPNNFQPKDLDVKFGCNYDLPSSVKVTLTTKSTALKGSAIQTTHESVAVKIIDSQGQIVHPEQGITINNPTGNDHELKLQTYPTKTTTGSVSGGNFEAKAVFNIAFE